MLRQSRIIATTGKKAVKHAELTELHVSNLAYSVSDIEATLITYVDEMGVF
jgi:hypothetical protein